MQVLRGLLLLLNSGTAFYGLQFVPLAEFTALVLLAPVMTTVIGAAVLKEPVSASRWAMVVLGVAGMLTVIRPAGVSALGWEALLPIGSAVCYAALQVLTRRIATLDDLILTNLISATIVTIVLGAAIWYSPLEVAPTLRAASASQWSFLLMLGCLATAGQVGMAAAVRVAPHSVLMPFAYVQIAFAAFIGWLVFGHMPDAWSVLGIGFICLGGVGTVWLNARH
jgi:drug/metabolite transporter (DMT)-like permease